MNVRQIPANHRWPSGDSQALAILTQGFDALTASYGFIGEERSDDLGGYRVVAIGLTSDEQAWLYKHSTDPNPGTLVYIDAKANVAQALSLLLEILGLSRAELDWAAT